MTDFLISAAVIVAAIIAFLVALGCCIGIVSIVRRGVSILFQPTAHEIEEEKELARVLREDERDRKKHEAFMQKTERNRA